MNERIAERRAELQQELERGQSMLAQLDQQRANLGDTLLRISGAIQICEELLAQPVAAVEGEAHGNNS